VLSTTKGTLLQGAGELCASLCKGGRKAAWKKQVNPGCGALVQPPAVQQEPATPRQQQAGVGLGTADISTCVGFGRTPASGLRRTQPGQPLVRVAEVERIQRAPQGH
jgi:hypothetical protein